MSKKDEALKLALEALGWYDRETHQKAITAIREALAEQPAQQPHCDDCGGFDPKCPLARPAQQQAYEEANPLGGPAKVFQAMANAIRAGDSYHAVLRQYGYADAQQQEPGRNHWEDGDVFERIAARKKQPAQQKEPVAWINWCAATGKRSVSFECESELASQPLYEGITQNTQYHYSKFHSWFDSELHRQKYTKDHPAYLAAQEAWNAANDAAQHRINRLNAEIEAWKVRFKIAEDALAKLKGPEQKPVEYWTVADGWVSEQAEVPAAAWIYPEFWDHCKMVGCGTAYRLPGDGRLPLYTSPPAQRKPLTDEEIAKIASTPCAVVGSYVHTFARAIEAAHGIKGDA